MAGDGKQKDSFADVALEDEQPTTSKGRLSILAYPELMEEWDWEKNEGIDPNEVSYRNDIKIHWTCKRGHQWQAPPNRRSRGSGCQKCAKQKYASFENSLATLHPDLAKEWHPDNIRSAKETLPGSTYKAKWQCLKNPTHVWETEVRTRASKGHGCRYCAGQDVEDKNRLSLLHPHLTKEWHPTRNQDKTPFDFAQCSGKKVWWQCKEGHEWKTRISDRSKNKVGCPVCAPFFSGMYLDPKQSFSARYPKLAKEWHPTKNGDLSPKQVSYSSAQIVWWQCHVHPRHKWQAAVYNRITGRGCKYCRRMREPNHVRELLVGISLDGMTKEQREDALQAAGIIRPTGRAKVITEAIKLGYLKEGALRDFLESSENDLKIIHDLGRIKEIAEGITRPAIKYEIRKKVYEKDNYTCQICKERGGKLVIDHFIPWVLGGAHKDENYWTLCRECNHKKWAHLPGEDLVRLWQESGRPPARALLYFEESSFCFSRASFR